MIEPMIGLMVNGLQSGVYKVDIEARKDAGILFLTFLDFSWFLLYASRCEWLLLLLLCYLCYPQIWEGLSENKGAVLKTIMTLK